MIGEPLQVVVADDHPLFREGVIASLSSDEGIQVVGEAGEADTAVRVVRETLPDVVLLDVDMPGSGLEAASRIASAAPATRVIMLTVSEDEDHLLSAMKAGASGYVLKKLQVRSRVEAALLAAKGGLGQEAVAH